ncbi:hypothetical protein [Modestobacter sp. SYSU DS0290]
MNAWLLRAPLWQVCLVMAVLLAPFLIAVFWVVRDMSPAATVSAGVVTAAICGPMVGYVTWRQTREFLPDAGSAPEPDQVEAERAARRGPVPEDDDVRAAALRIVEHRLALLQVNRSSALVSAAVVPLVAVFLTVAVSPWWWIGVVLGLALSALVLLTPAHLERRADLLRGSRR